MRTCLGAADEFADEVQLPQGWADGAAWLHCEGYALHRPAVALAALRAAKGAGARVGFPYVPGFRVRVLSSVRVSVAALAPVVLTQCSRNAQCTCLARSADFQTHVLQSQWRRGP